MPMPAAQVVGCNALRLELNFAQPGSAHLEGGQHAGMQRRHGLAGAALGRGRGKQPAGRSTGGGQRGAIGQQGGHALEGGGGGGGGGGRICRWWETN